MIGKPPKLRLDGKVAALPARYLARFRGTPIGAIADAQNGRGGLCHRINPVGPANAFAGRAVTCWCGPGDNLAALAAMELAQAGDVIVIATDGCETAGVVGDRFAAIGRNRGIAAVVTDGLVRDRAGIVASAVPCYARGVTATSAYANGPGEVNLPVVIGGVAVAAGDLMVGDADGVVVVARAAVKDVARRLKEVGLAEQKMEAEIEAGLLGFPGIGEMLGSPDVEWVEQ